MNLFTKQRQSQRHKLTVTKGKGGEQDKLAIQQCVHATAYKTDNQQEACCMTGDYAQRFCRDGKESEKEHIYNLNHCAVHPETHRTL